MQTKTQTFIVPFDENFQKYHYLKWIIKYSFVKRLVYPTIYYYTNI